MSLELDILRALLRLARRRSPTTLAQLADRVHGDDMAIHSALRSLAKSGLVQRTPAGLRLSLAGLAVAVASAQLPKTKATKPRTKSDVVQRNVETTRTPESTPVTAIGERRGSRHRAA